MASIVWSIDIFSRYPVPNGYGDREAIAMGSAGRTRKKLRTSLSAVRHLSTDATEMVERYRAGWPEGLLSKSRRPHLSPARKVSEQERAWIAELRQRGLGLLCIEVEQTRAASIVCTSACRSAPSSSPPRSPSRYRRALCCCAGSLRCSSVSLRAANSFLFAAIVRVAPALARV
jgi:hypothetical protein